MADITGSDIRQCLPQGYGHILQEYVDMKHMLTGQVFDAHDFLESAIVDFLATKVMRVTNQLSLGAPVIAYASSVDDTAAASLADRLHEILQTIKNAQ